jgi:hypothetical protein
VSSLTSHVEDELVDLITITSDSTIACSGTVQINVANGKVAHNKKP